MKIKDLMKKPAVVDKDISISEAARLMNKYLINSLIIEKNKKIIGIVTHFDLIKHFGKSKKIFEIMSKNVITLKMEDKIQKAIDIIKEKNISVFPVIDSEGELVGILDTKDLFKVWDGDDFLID